MTQSGLCLRCYHISVDRLYLWALWLTVNQMVVGGEGVGGGAWPPQFLHIYSGIFYSALQNSCPLERVKRQWRSSA